jgi:5-hydroxyisourate hydrolase-like protein (transthyretin family)
MRGIVGVVVALTVLAVVATTARADTTGTVTGHVVDAMGTPLAGICVAADTVPYPGSGFTGPQTDSNGSYSVSLQPGTYLISFQGCGQNYVTQFYPAQPSYQTAGQVTIVAGQTTGGIDARMALGGTITGKVLDQATGAPPPQFDIQVEAQTPGSSPFLYTPETVAYAPVATDGTYTLTGLAPGAYWVYFSAGNVNGLPAPYASAWYPDEPDPGHASAVSLQSGQTATLGIELAEAPGTVTGRVTDPNGAPVVGYTIVASIAQPDGIVGGHSGGAASTGPDGTFTLTGLAPGNWSITASHNGSSGPGSYTKSEPATVYAGATTPNIDFTFCIGAECPPTRVLTLKTRIQNHELMFAGADSDPSSAVLIVDLRGHIGRRRVNISNPNYYVTGGSFNFSMPLPRRDRALRTGVLTLDFAASDAASGGRFVLRVPGVFPEPASKPSRPHKPAHKRKRRRRGR